MGDNITLSELILKHKENSGLTYSQIAHRANLSKTTIQSWKDGLSKKPRFWQDLARFAAAVDLSKIEVNELLQVAGYPSVVDLQARGDNLELLENWSGSPIILQIPRHGAAHFRGRDLEQKQIEEMLFSGEKITAIQGMGGVGKSSLAIHMAYRLQHKFVHGVLWADVRNMEAKEIFEQWADVLGIELPKSENLKNLSLRMCGILSQKSALIVIDDAIDLRTIRLLLPPYQTPCSILVTTRNQEIASSIVTKPNRIISLSPTQIETSQIILSDILGREKVSENLETITEICTLLGNLPLALNIFGRRQRSSLATLSDSLLKLKNLSTRLDRLKINNEGVRLAFEQTWEELEAEDQFAFQSLAHFAGHPFSLDAFSSISEFEKTRC